MSLFNNPRWRELWLRRPRPTLWEGGFHDLTAMGMPFYYKIIIIAGLVAIIIKTSEFLLTFV